MLKKILICMSLVFIISVACVGSVLADSVHPIDTFDMPSLSDVNAMIKGNDPNAKICYYYYVTSVYGGFATVVVSDKPFNVNSINGRITLVSSVGAKDTSVVTGSSVILLNCKILDRKLSFSSISISPSSFFRTFSSIVYTNHDIRDGVSNDFFLVPTFKLGEMVAIPLGNLTRDFGATSVTLSVVGVIILCSLLVVFLIPRLVAWFN